MSTLRELATEPAVAAAEPLRETRPFYWSVRRELWENRWIYLAPLAIVAFLLFGYFFHTIGLLKVLRRVQDVVKLREMICAPYSALAGAVMMTAFLVSVFYCLESFQGERRDRSILFWKSLPLSDRTVALAKAAIPLFVIPLLMYAIIVVTQTFMLQFAVMRFMSDRQMLATYWSNLNFGQLLAAELYGIVAITLWHAPIYGWLLLVSGWAKRAATLWSVLPFLGLFAIEKMVFNTSSFADLIGYRFMGWFYEGFRYLPKGSPGQTSYPLQNLTPGRYFAAPGLWLGLLFAAAFLTLAVRARRHREPV